MTEKRFQLMSVHFSTFEVIIYDNLEDDELNLNICELVSLLNNVSQRDYDLKKLKEDICQKLDEVIRND